MSIPVSTVPQVKRYLFDGIKSKVLELPSTGYATPIVVYDEPGQYRPNDIITVGNVFQRMVQPMAMVGSGEAGWLKETYELECAIDIFRPGESLHTEATDRAYQLNSLVETVIREDPSLGGLVITAKPYFSSDASSWEKDHKGWIVHISHRFQILARI